MLSPERTDDELLRVCFERARAHPFFRTELAGIDDHRAAPSIGKATLLAQLRTFTPGAEARGVYLVRSGGSTNEPLVFPVDIVENHAQRAALAQHLRAAGIFGPHTVALNVFGYSELYRTAAIFDDLLERCEATTLAMSAHAPYADLLAIAHRFTPTHLLGTPSKLTLFARYLGEADVRLAIPQLVYGGEPLRESTTRLLAERFGVRQIWSLYGGAETGIWAWSDATRAPGLFALLPGIVVEVLDPDAEGFGALAVTNAYRARFPVFRYRVGDVGRIVAHEGSRYLELRGRDRRSFQFLEMTFDLDAIAALAAEAEAFQVQLRFDAHGRDTLRLLLVDQAGLCDPEAIARRLAALAEGPSYDDVLVVARSAREALHHDAASTKAPELVDFRR